MVASRQPSGYLHRAIAKYGAQAFDVTVLATAHSADELSLLEKEHIRALNCMAPNGYNMTAGGEGVLHPIPEVIEKIRRSKVGKIMTENVKQKISAALSGRVVSPSTRAALSASRQGMKFSPAHCAALSQARKGVSRKKPSAPMSAEQRAKLSVAISKKWDDPTYRAAVVASAKEKVFSEEARAKIGAQSARNWADSACRARIIESQRAVKRMNAAQTSEVMREKWADPEFRASMLAARARAREARKST